MYVCIYIYIYVNMYIYIYIYIEREREIYKAPLAVERLRGHGVQALHRLVHYWVYDRCSCFVRFVRSAARDEHQLRCFINIGYIISCYSIV